MSSTCRKYKTVVIDPPWHVGFDCVRLDKFNRTKIATTNIAPMSIFVVLVNRSFRFFAGSSLATGSGVGGLKPSNRCIL